MSDVSVGLVEACDDPNLLGAGLDLWPVQRRALEAADRDGARTHVWAMGRRSGKSSAMALIGLWTCLLRPELRSRLRQGERGYAVAVAPNLRQSRRFVADAKAIVEGSPILRGELVSETLDELTFSTGMTFAAFPASSRGARGWPIACLMLDEAAWFVADENESNQTAEQVWRALAPATAQFGDLGRVIVASTPFGQDGFFPDFYRRATSGELPDVIAQHATTAEANPTIDAGFLEQERARDPESFKAEYEAEFVGSGGAFLDPADVSAAVVDRGELPAEASSKWVCGLDPSFSSDPFGVCVVGRDLEEPRRLVVAAARSWRPRRRKPRSLEEARAVEDEVLAEVAALCSVYGGHAVTDQYKAQGVADRLRRLGVSVRVVTMSAASKTAVFRELRARLVAGELELYPEQQLLTELRRIRARFTSGRAAVEIPRVGGSHGDVAQALALAVWELRRSPLRPGSVLDDEEGWGDPLAHRRERALDRLDGGADFLPYDSSL